MSNVFISHSSHDKPFVKRLACALLSSGFPVWMDTWRMEMGDSLLDQIYSGIESSSVVILVISKNAVESGWVNRELNAALTKEQQIGRNFLIPIKVDACPAPLKTADRIYADFSSSFSAPFSALSSVLQKRGIGDISVDPDREILALTFTRAVHLNMASFEKNAESIRRRQGKVTLNVKQVVVADDPEYEALLRRLHRRLDNMAADPYYSPDLESYLRMLVDRVLELEHHLSAGIALLYASHPERHAAYWYAKMIRGEAVYRLWSAQMPNGPDNLDYGKEWDCASLSSNTAAAKFFETERVEAVHVWTDESKPFSIWLGSEELSGLRDDLGRYSGPEAFYDAVRGYDIDKYIYPQMMLQHLSRGTPMIWNLNAANIGLR